jgi:hypothetical protein
MDAGQKVEGWLFASLKLRLSCIAKTQIDTGLKSGCLLL